MTIEGYDEERDRRGVTLTLQVCAAVGLGHLSPAAAAGLTTAAHAAIPQLVDRLWPRSAHRAASVVAAAAELADLTIGELLDSASASELKEELTIRVLRAAADTGVREKLIALSRCLANGVSRDDAEVEPELLFVQAVADLGPPHIKLLNVLAQEPGPWGEHGRTFYDPPRSFNRIALHSIVPELTPAMATLLGTLAAHGLIEDETDLGHGSAVISGGKPMPSWRATSHGRDLLARMGAIADSADAGG